MCRWSEPLLNCVRRKIRRRSELRQLLIGMSTRRYLPASGTAGLARSFVKGNSRVPAPPPMMIARVSSDGIFKFITCYLLLGHSEHRTLGGIGLPIKSLLSLSAVTIGDLFPCIKYIIKGRFWLRLTR